MFSKILIANRGEIAVRIARTCRELGVQTVVVFSDPDSGGRHVELADEAVRLPGSAPADTYLNVDAVVEAARSTGAEAVHPGYGFLSERADAAEAFGTAGILWVGPSPEALRAAGDKVRARRLAESAGVSVVPGTLDPVRDIGEVHAFGERYGYPIAIKAAGGGGGRGLKVAWSTQEVDAAFESTVREAEAYFGYGAVYLERYLPRPKHLEVQILAEAPGRAVWLGVRDCSVQRRHQKLLEETPPPLFAAMSAEMGEAASLVANACGYTNAGTVEFLVDPDAPGATHDRAPFYFLEINARLQVEHTITEEVLGIDLVAAQLRIAAGEPPVPAEGGGRGSRPRPEPRGHAIECRINAEDPSRGFAPGPGRIVAYREPGGPGIRVDSGFGEGDEVPAAYDSLIAKLVAWGATRNEARRRMLRALDEFRIEGVPTTIPAHRVLLAHSDFVDGTYTTRTAEGGALVVLEAAAATLDGAATAGEESLLMVDGARVRLWHPAVAGSVSAATRAAATAGSGEVVSPMHGTILKVLVSEGDEVERGDPVAVLEAMKMETHVASTAAGRVDRIQVTESEVVEAGQVIALVAPSEDGRT